MDTPNTARVDAELSELRLRIEGVHERLDQQQLDEAVARFETLTRFRRTLLSLAPAPVASLPTTSSSRAMPQVQRQQQRRNSFASGASSVATHEVRV